MSRSSPMSFSACPHGLTTYFTTRKQKMSFGLQGSFQDQRSAQIKDGYLAWTCLVMRS